MAHILIADDEPSVLKLMAAILAKAGHTIATSSSGSEALKKLGIRPEDASIEPPDLVVLDIMMPKLDGYLVGQLIRNHPRTRAIPILAVSALRELSRLFTATVEVQGFLHKPFAPDELIGCVAKILDRSKSAG
ncbi:MAG: response regulator [Elusimicrobia bacterium]|nr:response regulator [Elusimicrobiota bacterium]